MLCVWDPTVWRFDLGLWRPGCVSVAVGSGRLLFLDGAYDWCMIFEAFIYYMPLFQLIPVVDVLV